MHYRCSRALLVLISALACSLSQAEPVIGQTIPPLSIETYGELVMDSERDEVVYAPWSTENFKTKPEMHAVMYLPAAFSANSSNVPYTEMLGTPEIRERSDYIRSTTILNIDTGGWGGPEMVLGPIRYTKRKRPYATLVADADGQAIAAWGLNDPRAIMVLDQHGTVLFYGEGELSAGQLQEVERLLREGADAIMSDQEGQAELPATAEHTEATEAS